MHKIFSCMFRQFVGCQHQRGFAVVHTTDHSESTTLTTVKNPWWWHTWSVETCRKRFCASVVYS